MDVVVVAVFWALNDKLEKGLADETSGAVKPSRREKRQPKQQTAILDFILQVSDGRDSFS